MRMKAREDVHSILHTVKHKRAVSTTRCNARSSRSHVIFRIELQRIASSHGGSAGADGE
jgi:hypothetical protein